MSMRRPCVCVGLLLAVVAGPGLRAQGPIPPGTRPTAASALAIAPASPGGTPMPGTIPPQAWVANSSAAPDGSAGGGTAPAAMPLPPVTEQGGDNSQPSALQPPEHHFPLEASWDNGLHLESEDKSFSVHVGGIAQIDSVWLIGPQSVFAAPGGGSNGVGNAQATQIRRAILQADGGIFDQFDYSVEFDFANASNDNSGLQPPSFSNLTSSPAPMNIWMQVRDVPYLGNVRFGHQDKPIGMVNNTSSTNLPFMERPDNQDAFYGPFDNGYTMGLASWNWSESERFTWRYGVYQPATNVFGVALNKYTIGARVTGLPWYEDDGERLIHLGLGYEGGELVEDELRVRARPVLRNAPGFAVPVLADTDEVPGSRQYTIAPEFAMVLGSLTLQAEYAGQFLTDAVTSTGQNQGTVFYHGGYVEALYFLTGEHQEYVRREGVFGRVVPEHDYHWKKGDAYRACGAWQVGVRFSYLDLNDKAIQGGQIYDCTVGVNWYLNPSMKVECNYIAEHRDTPGVPVGWINGVGVRAAYDF